MKAEDLKLEELVHFSDGAVNLHGRRLILHALHAFAHMRKDLHEMVGPEQTRRIYTRYGYFWGNADAAAMKRIFTWDSVAEWMKAGARMPTLQGLAKTVYKTLELEPAHPCLKLEIVWHDSGEAEAHLLELGPSAHPICWLLTGYASGYASFCLGRNIYFIEQKCRAQGDRVCMALGQDEAAWGSALVPHAPYFEAFDIQGKVQELTRELKRKTVELAKQRSRLETLEHAVKSSTVEARSELFRRVLELSQRVAPYDSAVLITGESGVGKEVLARHIHTVSHRAAGPFVAVNCGALPETLLEGELFGHKAGSFTGATHDRIGLFEQAGSGTLFLDEIGDITPTMQVKLLRVLQTKEIMRVGESKTRKIDVRVIAATNRNLPLAIREGRFREDLYYRLRVIELEIPPLRARRDDILPLARFFVKQFSRKLRLPDLRLDATTLDYLQAYAWPGNVRELENAIERAAVLSHAGVIVPESLPPTILHASTPPAASVDPGGRTLAQVADDQIRAVLEMTGGNRTRAAKALGISPATLWRRLKKDPRP